MMTLYGPRPMLGNDLHTYDPMSLALHLAEIPDEALRMRSPIDGDNGKEFMVTPHIIAQQHILWLQDRGVVYPPEKVLIYEAMQRAYKEKVRTKTLPPLPTPAFYEQRRLRQEAQRIDVTAQEALAQYRENLKSRNATIVQDGFKEMHRHIKKEEKDLKAKVKKSVVHIDEAKVKELQTSMDQIADNINNLEKESEELKDKMIIARKHSNEAQYEEAKLKQ